MIIKKNEVRKFVARGSSSIPKIKNIIVANIRFNTYKKVKWYDIEIISIWLNEMRGKFFVFLLAFKNLFQNYQAFMFALNKGLKMNRNGIISSIEKIEVNHRLGFERPKFIRTNKMDTF